MLNATTELKDSDFAKKHLKEKIDQYDDYEESQSSETNNKQTDRRGYAVPTNTIIQMPLDKFQEKLEKALIDPGQCRLVAAPDGGLEYKVTIKEISITNVTSPPNPKTNSRNSRYTADLTICCDLNGMPIHLQPCKNLRPR